MVFARSPAAACPVHDEPAPALLPGVLEDARTRLRVRAGRG